MPMDSLLEEGGFDPEAARMLTTAFDRAWARFKLSGSTLAGEACAPSTRALLAKRIIEQAQTGEKDIERLIRDGVAYLEGVIPPSQSH